MKFSRVGNTPISKVNQHFTFCTRQTETKRNWDSESEGSNSLIIGFFCTTIYFERQLFPEGIASTVHWGGRPLIKPSEWLRH